MTSYVVLLRGINVGGKNKVSMAELRVYLEELGFEGVSTYINSGNVLLKSTKSKLQIADQIEALLPDKFKLDSSIVRVLVLSRTDLQRVVQGAPKEFGAKPDTYHSDAIFLMGITIKDALAVFDPREGVDAIWPGEGVVYSQRLSAQRTKSRLSKIIGTAAYQNMTIRSWKTTTKLLNLLETQEL